MSLCMDNNRKSPNLLLHSLRLLWIAAIKSTNISIEMEFKFMRIATIAKSAKTSQLMLPKNPIINIRNIHNKHCNIIAVTPIITNIKTIETVDRTDKFPMVFSRRVQNSITLWNIFMYSGRSCSWVCSFCNNWDGVWASYCFIWRYWTKSKSKS